MPFPIKALKLVLAELQSDGEPASLSYGGIGQHDVDRDIESDDGEDDWSDDGDVPARPEPSGALNAGEMAYVKEMLGGQEVPQEVFAAISGKCLRRTASRWKLIGSSRWPWYCGWHAEFRRFRR